MKVYIKLAWRNIWRNKRRTIITIASIFFAVFFALCMRSYMLGSYAHWVNIVIEAYTGYIQIQHKEYQNDRTIDNSFELSDQLIKKVGSTDNIKQVVPRIESMALASSGELSKAAIVLGVDPVAENKLTKLENKLVRFRLTGEALEKIGKEDLPDEIREKLKTLRDNSYSNTSKLELDLGLNGKEAEKYIPLITKHAGFNSSFLMPDDKGVLVADRLAKYLKISINDSLILLGQGYHGASAAGIFPVRGILKFPAPDLDKRMVYMALPAAQEYLDAGNNITYLALNLNKHDDDNLDITVNTLKNTIGNDNITVKNWKQLNKEMVQGIKADNASGLIMLAILYIIIAFGIFGTVLMMTAERRREFGVMVSIGMRKTKLAVIVTIEMILLGIIGIITGIAGSMPVILYFVNNPIRLTGEMAKTMENFGMEPILPWAWQLDFFVNQSVVVIFLVLIAIIYPLIKVMKLNEVKAMRA